MIVTLKDIAKKVGYSVSIVSRALNNKSYVKDSTRELIVAVSREMGYYPNRAARSLVNHKTETIGIFVASISEEYYASIIKGLQFANQADYTLIFLNSFQSQGYEKFLNRVDGLIIFSSQIKERNRICKLINREIPLVLVESCLSDAKANCIWVNNVHGGYIATKHLIELGHTRIAHITGNLKYQVLLDRLEGYKEALFKSNLLLWPELIITGNYSSEDGYWAMKQLLANEWARARHFTAVFVANDQIAFGVLQGIYEAGLSVPGDISVVGYDDIEFSKYTNPPLTTVRQPGFKMGKKAMAILTLILKNRVAKNEGIKICLMPELIIRSTTNFLPNHSDSLVTVDYR